MTAVPTSHDDGSTGGHTLTDDTQSLGALTHSMVWATWALFVGLGMMLTGAGLFATIVGVRAERSGFPTLTLGLVGAGYYLGFLLGSRIALRALGRVGHIRVYAALASVLSAVILAAGMYVEPWAWILVRLLSGACLAGQYVVAESWLNQLVTNDNRARILSMYSLVTIVAYGIGQLGLTVFDPERLTAFGMAAIVISLAVAPVALSEDAAPPIAAEPEHMSLRELMRIVPTGVVTSTLVGVAHGAFLGLGAVYASRSGMSTREIGSFVAMPTLGCLLLQVPISSAADDIDRRAVGALAALTAAGGGVALLLVEPSSWLGYAAMAIIGGTTYPLYSIAGAYTNDWVPTAKLTAVASQLVILFGAGAFVGPFLASILMSGLGTDGFAWTTIGVHAAIALFLAVRIFQWRAPLRAKPWNDVALAGRVFYVPATVVGMGRRLRASRNVRVRLPGMDEIDDSSR